MSRAAIVATARTPIGKAYRGAFNNTQGQELAAHAISHALDVAGIEAALVEDVVLGCAVPEGTTGFNVARQAALRAGMPTSVPGMTVDRQCSSGLMAIAIAAQRLLVDGLKVAVGGGVESISLVQNEHNNRYRAVDPWLDERVAGLYYPMVRTAEIVALRYGISRERQDETGAESHRRAAAAQDSGLMDAEIAPMTVVKIERDRESGESREVEITITQDEGLRRATTPEGLAALRTVLSPDEAGGAPSVTAGNASQLSDGASASILMDSDYAAALGLEPLGYYCGLAVTGCDPEEMGVGPVAAVPKLLERHGLTVGDIGVWELNEAFASQAVYCRDALEIDPEKCNVNGGAIALGHPYGMTGARAVGHALLEARRRGEQFAVVSMCIGGGMGAAGLFELA
ncbi:acetyl-CoA C-acyltransferase [Streptomyces sp. NPDC056296]|uniref:acetyl-CoA C-acyltransferase n=1 Tax=Streptomyces sp. NPDC056296 TaxID=3345775 RepID=UPI0035D574A1